MKLTLPLFLRRHIASRGHYIYRTRVRPLHHPARKGEMVEIDVISGDYEIDPDPIAANKRLRARRPNGRFWGERIGYRTSYSYAGGLTEDDDD